MVDVLLVSKPIVPPWHDSSKNLVRDLATHMTRHVPIVLSQPGVHLDMPRARVEPLYAPYAGAFSPALRENARVLTRLLTGSRREYWHFFFAPNPKTSTVARAAARLRRVRTIQTVCSAPHPRVPVRAVLFGDRVVVLSEHTRRRFLEAGVAPARMQLVRPSVPLLPPLAAERVSSARQRLKLPIGRPLIVYAGDLEFGRGAELAVQAFIDLPATLDACLVMACRTKTAEAKARAHELQRMAETAGAASRIVWFGETPFIHDLLAVADLVTLPADSLYAKMDIPLVLLEAMALERAVLVGNGTPAEELATEGGAVAVETTRDAVATATRNLLDDGARRAELGARARSVVERDYDARRMTAAYEAIYDELK